MTLFSDGEERTSIHDVFIVVNGIYMESCQSESAFGVR